MIFSNTILQINIAEEFACPHIAAAHPSAPNRNKASESRPEPMRQGLFQQPARGQSPRAVGKVTLEDEHAEAGRSMVRQRSGATGASPEGCWRFRRRLIPARCGAPQL